MEDAEGEEEEEEDSITVQSKSPPATTSSASANAKKHAIEDGVNGVSKKRRKRVTASVDGDVTMAEAVPSPPLTEETPTTNGRSVGTQIEDPMEILEADILIGEDGDKGILSCAWNPGMPTLLATASDGSVARIWNVPEDATSEDKLEHFVLSHEPSRTVPDKANVTAVRWCADGSRLATGSYDGQTRIWSADGNLEYSMLLHFAPISSLKWNKASTILLALSCDGKMIAWDAGTGESRRVFDFKETMTDVEWISDTQFMGGGDVGNIHQFDIGVEGAVHSRMVHEGEVSCIAWDEQTNTVATGGHDTTIMVPPTPTATAYISWNPPLTI